MTPFALRLQRSLEAESEKMNNEWLFRWHAISRMITIGGVQFSGSAREVYWSAMRRYAQKKIGDIYETLESELLTFPGPQRASAISETKDITQFHVGRILRTAVEKDRILRGNGVEFPPQDSFRVEAIQTHANSLIAQRDHALRQYHQIGNRWRRLDDVLGEYPNILKVVLSVGLGGVLGFISSHLLPLLKP
jgi:hypothetical protein